MAILYKSRVAMILICGCCVQNILYAFVENLEKCMCNMLSTRTKYAHKRTIFES